MSVDAGTDERLYADLRPLLFSIAYGITASVGEAEDLVQEAFLRLHRARSDGERVAAPKAWLSTVVTRLAINHVRSARARRETYVGTWLPEPLVANPGPDAAERVETAESLSLALLVVLQSLTPVERAVFLLREVFGCGYDEVAAVVGKSEDNCRQIAARARRHVAERRPRFDASRRRRDELAARFFEAAGGATEGLIDLLARDVVIYGDGGGKTRTFLRPVRGRERVASVLAELRTWLGMLGASDMYRAEVNGQPGAVYVAGDGRPVAVLALDVVDGQIAALRAVTNPDKLTHVPPARS